MQIQSGHGVRIKLTEGKGMEKLFLMMSQFTMRQIIGLVIILTGFLLLSYVYNLYRVGIKNFTILPANPFSWMVFSAISCGNAIVLWNSIISMMVFFPVLMMSFQFLIALESYKKKKDGHLELFDIAGLVIAIIAIVIWVLIGINILNVDQVAPETIVSMMGSIGYHSNDWIASILILIADSMGIIPTVRDMWRNPDKDTVITWSLFLLSGILILAGLYLFIGRFDVNAVYAGYETGIALIAVLVGILGLFLIGVGLRKAVIKKGSWALLFFIREILSLLPSLLFVPKWRYLYYLISNINNFQY